MNNDLRQEMLVILTNEKICVDCQLKINASLGYFLNNQKYTSELHKLLNNLISNRTIDFFSEFPKIISLIIEFNKSIVCTYENIDKDYMKFIIYGIVYNYLDTEQNTLLNTLDPGLLRIVFVNTLQLLLLKPKKLNVHKQTIFSMLANCICGNDDVIKI
jgi:hypothetical protein